MIISTCLLLYKDIAILVKGQGIVTLIWLLSKKFKFRLLVTSLLYSKSH